MWNELKQLIQTRLAARPRPRRAGEPRFRGQFERLEAREVLSATIGVMAVDVEAGTITIAVWESRRELPEPPQFVAFERGAELHEANFDGQMFDRVSVAGNYGVQDKVFAGIGGGPGFHGGADFYKGPNAFGFLNQYLDFRPPAFPVTNNVQSGNGQGTVLDVAGPGDSTGQSDPFDFESQLGGNKGDRGPQLASYDESGGLGDSNPGQSNVNYISDSQRRPDPPLRPQIVALSFPAFSAVSEVAEKSPLSIDTTGEARDSAFGEYSPESLLLAASVDGDADDDDLGLGEDESDDMKSEAAADDSALALVGDTAESLNALEREQAAIDEVLAELHDLNLHQEDPSTDPAQAHDQSQSHLTREAAENGGRTYDQEFGGANFSQADGGMVLLEPTGDANSSAYDLTAVLTREFARPHDVALGLEATVGLQQAFDVGSNERFESTSVRTPVAQPAAAAAQPNVSAENAPAKKSDQPS